MDCRLAPCVKPLMKAEMDQQERIDCEFERRDDRGADAATSTKAPTKSGTWSDTNHRWACSSGSRRKTNRSLHSRLWTASNSCASSAERPRTKVRSATVIDAAARSSGFDRTAFEPSARTQFSAVGLGPAPDGERAPVSRAQPIRERRFLTFLAFLASRSASAAQRLRFFFDEAVSDFRRAFLACFFNSAWRALSFLRPLRCDF